MTSYRLSRLADIDLESIAEYGIERFGVDQAYSYYQGLVDQLRQLAESPLMYPAVDDIRPGYRRCVYEAHSVYYMLGEEEVLVIRILGMQDIDQSLPDAE